MLFDYVVRIRSFVDVMRLRGVGQAPWLKHMLKCLNSHDRDIVAIKLDPEADTLSAQVHEIMS